MILAACLLAGASSMAADWAVPDKMLAEYFKHETAKLRDKCLADVTSLDDWKQKRVECRTQLFEMLGLDPMPAKTELHPVVTGVTEHGEFRVEKLHFQSRPKLYVTANLYIPKSLGGPAPAILYVCGHGGVKKDGVSYGNKVRYQHHAAWFARRGYVCLVIDSLQLGEIEAIHHGTYRYNMWWWNCLGYSSAAVEAWNCIRALDYLETREEVDVKRIGVTGRSGGGAYSWWIAALDERIKAAVPVAGIADLQNHIVDGCVEGHCDCMYIVNTYQWDYPLVAALVAPRPLLISNSDKDTIFPLDGVVRVHSKVRDIYRLCEADKNLGLHITEGPHRDTQELRIHAFVWFNRFLKDERPLIDKPAVPFFEPEQLKVFDELPADQINTKIQEQFVARASAPPVPTTAEQWAALRDEWHELLRTKCFAGWPSQTDAGPLGVRPALSVRKEGVHLRAYDFNSQDFVPLRMFVLTRAGLRRPRRVVLDVLDGPAWKDWLGAMAPAFGQDLGEYEPTEKDPNAFGAIAQTLREDRIALVCVCPRGIGAAAWSGDERKQTQIRRRFMLLGQTADGMRVWDVRRTVQAIRSLDRLKRGPIVLKGHRHMAGVALYASLFEPDIAGLELHELPSSHKEGPIVLNVLRYLDLPQAVAMAAERCPVTLHQTDPAGWDFPQDVVESLDWPSDQFRVVTEP